MIYREKDEQGEITAFCQNQSNYPNCDRISRYVCASCLDGFHKDWNLFPPQEDLTTEIIVKNTENLNYCKKNPPFCKTVTQNLCTTCFYGYFLRDQ